MKIKGVNVNLGDMVHVFWEDHWGSGRGGWMTQDEINTDPLVCETVGWVIKVDNKGIATTQGVDGQYPNPHIQASFSYCPMRMVVKIKVLRKNRKIKFK